MYTGQPTRQKKPSAEPEQMETELEQQDVTPDEQTNLSPTIIEETPTEDMPPPTTIQETPVSQMPQPNDTENNLDIESTTPSTQSSRETPRLSMDLRIDEFPTLPTKQPTIIPTNITTTDDTEFSDDSVDQSPVVTMQQPIQTTFKRPLQSTSDSEEQNIKITEEQHNTVIKVCRELHRYNFRDVDKLQTNNMHKKKENHLPSNVHRTR